MTRPKSAPSKEDITTLVGTLALRLSVCVICSANILKFGGFLKRVLALILAALVLAGCSDPKAASPSETSKPSTAATSVADQPVVLPDYSGKNLSDVEDELGKAGLESEVSADSGKAVILHSNWIVIKHAPAAGASVPKGGTVQLTVTKKVEPSKSASATPAALPVLTIQNNPELRALLAGSDGDMERIQAFADKYEGQTIEFDGNIANMMPHADFKTRYDMLILAGDYSETSAKGPNFKFEDINVQDLHLTGANVSAVGQGDNLRFTAVVGEYNADNGLFFLDPVSTKVR
jgi:Domain of unknown function (DUF4839)/PASTA domain